MKKTVKIDDMEFAIINDQIHYFKGVWKQIECIAAVDPEVALIKALLITKAALKTW